MPCLTNNQKNSNKANEVKANKQNNANNSEKENSDNFSYDEAIENNNATSIFKLQQTNVTTSEEADEVELSNNE
ncbi:20648_t:CDS:2 [Gigaspora margarita]|uniref:20648_t:CDS:1 n=1 Tax=Gigaspora margarita TaxID=4874 RepID=A0ABN7UA29_GIGMA|nr:20648_t:CDS:2 [Gigaspora margarita]